MAASRLVWRCLTVLVSYTPKNPAAIAVNGLSIHPLGFQGSVLAAVSMSGKLISLYFRSCTETRLACSASETVCTAWAVVASEMTHIQAAFVKKLNAKGGLAEVSVMALVYKTTIYAFNHISHLRQGYRVLM